MKFVETFVIVVGYLISIAAIVLGGYLYLLAIEAEAVSLRVVCVAVGVLAQLIGIVGFSTMGRKE